MAQENEMSKSERMYIAHLLSPTPFNDVPYIDGLHEPMECTDEGCMRMYNVCKPRYYGGKNNPTPTDIDKENNPSLHKGY